jgi:hypothetical protein
VVYSAEFPALPADLAGRSFKRVFGATQSCMELFLLKRDLMGPCWLTVKVAARPRPPARALRPRTHAHCWQSLHMWEAACALQPP